MEIKDKVRSATKWTLLTEFMAKIITPITGMILARLLTPESFGVMASIMVVTSFAEIFADAGFQKYFVQHEFFDELEKRRCFGTAIMTSCLIALVIWLFLVCFSKEIAIQLGTVEIADGIKVAGFALVLTSYNGMQAAIFKRTFQFNLLFRLRIITLLIPLVVTIPMAYMGAGFWALIWGMLVQQGTTCFAQARYTNMPLWQEIDLKRLSQMLSFSIWTLFESITIWFSTYGGMFFVGVLLSSYYLGLYKGILSLSGAAFGIITGAISPVLFSALSRLQNDMSEFRRIFYAVQSKAALALMPLGVLLFVFSDVVIKIILGNQWSEGVYFFGVWSLTTVFSILINSLASEALRAKGMPRLSAFSQVLHFPVLWLGLWYGAKFSFDAVALGLCASSFWLDFVKGIMLRQVLGCSVRRMMTGIANAAIPAAIAGFLAWKIRMLLSGHHESLSIIVAFLIFFLCYMSLILIGKNNRKLVFDGFNFLRSKFYR